MPNKSDFELMFEEQVKELKTPYATQYKFSDDRKWTCDFYLPKYKLLVEIEGGVWIMGRHSRGAGFVKDCEKYNTAVCKGYSVMRMPTQWVKNNIAIGYVKMFIELFNREGKNVNKQLRSR